MESIGVRDLRQRASEILKDVEAGASFTITVSGRPVAKIVPFEPDGPQTWVPWRKVQVNLSTAVDPTWDDERREFGVGDIVDPWERDAHSS